MPELQLAWTKQDTSSFPLGHRIALTAQDNIVDLANLVPPLQDISKEVEVSLAEDVLLPIDVAGDRQYFVSLRHGILSDKAGIFKLLRGSPLQQVASKEPCAAKHQ